ncbi:MAG: hypothetical protein HC921_10795 [Synechococcaceae cyanobacterium SM2_3_1]|nr:hypothetical protein [Synechococcaceae cyanobacterium SM2_3_1]
MNELETLARKTLYLMVGSGTVIFEQASQLLQEWGEQAQAVVDDLIAEGEVKVNAWSHSHQASDRVTSLQQRLQTLVHGDWDLAERLLTQVRLTYPGHEEDWYLEKVIHDLERDHQH